MNTISFSTTPEELAAIQQISEWVFRHGYSTDRIGVEMDLAACHNMDSRLDLVGMAEAFLDPKHKHYASAVHDVFGIVRHLNRETGKLGGFFSPRFTVARVEEGAA